MFTCREDNILQGCECLCECEWGMKINDKQNGKSLEVIKYLNIQML